MCDRVETIENHPVSLRKREELGLKKDFFMCMRVNDMLHKEWSEDKRSLIIEVDSSVKTIYAFTPNKSIDQIKEDIKLHIEEKGSKVESWTTFRKRINKLIKDKKNKIQQADEKENSTEDDNVTVAGEESLKKFVDTSFQDNTGNH